MILEHNTKDKKWQYSQNITIQKGSKTSVFQCLVNKSKLKVCWLLLIANGGDFFFQQSISSL